MRPLDIRRQELEQIPTKVLLKYHRREPLALVAGCFMLSSMRFEGVRAHDLRHTWASWHVMHGTSLQELMALGGWRSYEMVLRYAHLAPEHLADAAARIERRLSVVTEGVTNRLR